MWIIFISLFYGSKFITVLFLNVIHKMIPNITKQHLNVNQSIADFLDFLQMGDYFDFLSTHLY